MLLLCSLHSIPLCVDMYHDRKCLFVSLDAMHLWFHDPRIIVLPVCQVSGYQVVVRKFQSPRSLSPIPFYRHFIGVSKFLNSSIYQ